MRRLGTVLFVCSADPILFINPFGAINSVQPARKTATRTFESCSARGSGCYFLSVESLLHSFVSICDTQITEFMVIIDILSVSEKMTSSPFAKWEGEI